MRRLWPALLLLAALAYALAEWPTENLCPCSRYGVCRCGEGGACGCIEVKN